jgi:S-formylglutathione hydrolase FrmB
MACGMKPLLILLACVIGAITHASEPDSTISEAKPDTNGFLIHDVKSPFESGTTQIRVLLPEPLDKGRSYPVVYVLPVEKLNENRFGDGLLEVKKRNLQNLNQAIFVAPTFSHLPWYADHPTNLEIRQESYLLKVVLPYIEKTYPVRTDADGRLLLGFSKSGWGAFSLLLRHLDLFGKAAAWDAPLMMNQPGKYGSGDIFGSQENFEPYQITKRLERRAPDLQRDNRLILLGYGNFREQHQQLHSLMQKLKIAHEYQDGPKRKHEWSSGWVPEAVNSLLSPTSKTKHEVIPARD